MPELFPAEAIAEAAKPIRTPKATTYWIVAGWTADGLGRWRIWDGLYVSRESAEAFARKQSAYWTHYSIVELRLGEQS